MKVWSAELHSNKLELVHSEEDRLNETKYGYMLVYVGCYHESAVMLIRCLTLLPLFNRKCSGTPS